MKAKYFTCCGDCKNYNWKKHKCNLGAHIETDARYHFYDDCPLPTIDVPDKKDGWALDECPNCGAKMDGKEQG